MEVIASAPGKVFLLGEYAVALGAPAVVAAVERRLVCRARAEAGTGRLGIRAGDREWSGPLAAQGLDDAPAHVRFAAAAARVSARRLDLRGVDIEIETRSELDTGGAKAGLGASAAAVAAVTAAVHRLAGHGSGDASRVASLGVAAHRFAQGGGSGGDVVASCLGGVHRVSRLDASEPPRSVDACLAGVEVAAERIALPEVLRLEVVATGEAAETGPRVRRFVQRARGEGPSRAVLDTWVKGVTAAVEAFCDACRRGDASDALAAVQSARTLQERLGALAGIRIFSPGLRRACGALATERHLAIKPSGAGGGDCAVALVDAARASELRTAWREAGLRPLDAEASLDGVRVRVVSEGTDG